MTWMNTGDPVKDAKLHEAYKHCLHITSTPYYSNQRYDDFNQEVFERMREAPFFVNLSSVDGVVVRKSYNNLWVDDVVLRKS